MMTPNCTILIVDDEPETLQGYQEFLSLGGPSVSSRKSSRRSEAVGAQPPLSTREEYRLLLASSGEQAVELVKKELADGGRVAAGFFDVKLGAGMDGLATLQAVRELEPEIHCAVVTAYHDRTVEEINQLFGDDFKDQWDYLNKPFTQGEIVQKARQMVAAWNRKRELEALHSQLVKSERLAAIGQVARGVGHEFGNILLRIMGKADLALGEKDLTKVHDHVKVVLSASERAGVIVRNLQSFSKADPSFQHGSVTQPIEQCISLINHEMTKASVKLEKIYGEVPDIKLDPGGMAQVILNLMINAIHAMPKGGQLKVSVEKQKNEGADGVGIRIADTGTGIPEEALSRIFEFAFTTKGDKGSGLGLSIAKEIVEAHRGTLSVKSEVGKGTEFTIWVPV